MYKFNANTLLDWITAFAIFEIPMAYFYLSISGKNDMVTDWYSGNTINIWNVIAQDSLYVICGIILTYTVFNYLVKKNLINKHFFYFILVFLVIQIIGDILFAILIKNWPNKYSTKWVNYFKKYIKTAGFNALFGDSLYVIAWSIAFYLVSNYIKSFPAKIFIICLFFFCVSAYSVR